MRPPPVYSVTEGIIAARNTSRQSQPHATTAGRPAANRLCEVLALIGQADPDTLAAALPALYTEANFARAPIEERIGAYADWRSRGGFEPVETIRNDPLAIEIIARQRVTDEHWRMAIEVSKEPPHRIDALLLGRAPMPAAQVDSDAAVAVSFLEHVDRLAGHELFSGAVLIGRHGRILGQRAFGLANRDFRVPNTLETRFNVASLTKSWTAVATCQLVESGRISLDDCLGAFLSYPDTETAHRIKIRHLLSHTSGLGTYFNARFDATPRTRIRDLDDFLNLAADERPRFAPGAAWHYSNVGMILLGKVIETVTGTSYHQHVEAEVLARAGMTDAGFIELDRVNQNVAVGYHRTWTRSGPVVANTVFDWAVRGAPDGCGFATVADIWAFAEALRAGRLVSEAMVETMTTAKPELGSPYYGYGFSVHPKRALFGHSGGLVGASANLDMTVAPDGWTIIVLANDLSMRAPVIKARQLIGMNVPEDEEGRAYLPRAGMTAR